MDVKIGTKGSLELEVTYEATAQALRSGNLPVFGTPFLVAIVEGASVNALAPFLGEGEATVGTAVNIAHVSSTPIGMKVRSEAEVVGVSPNGKIIEFKVAAYDETGLIGSGTHQRAVINPEKFMAKTEAKLEQAKAQK